MSMHARYSIRQGCRRDGNGNTNRVSFRSQAVGWVREQILLHEEAPHVRDQGKTGRELFRAQKKVTYEKQMRNTQR